MIEKTETCQDKRTGCKGKCVGKCDENCIVARPLTDAEVREKLEEVLRIWNDDTVTQRWTWHNIEKALRGLKVG